jgi:hypothetical protein
MRPMYSAKTPNIRVSTPNIKRTAVIIDPNPVKGTPLVIHTKSIMKNATRAASDDKNPTILIALIGKYE